MMQVTMSMEEYQQLKAEIEWLGSELHKARLQLYRANKGDSKWFGDDSNGDNQQASPSIGTGETQTYES